MKDKRHFTSVPPPELSTTIRPPSRSQSPVLAMYSTLPAPTMSRRTYALPYNKVRSSNDNTTPCRLVYKYSHPGEPCRMHSRAIILGRRHVCRYTGNVSEEIAASSFSVTFAGWDTSPYRTAHHKKGSKTALPRSSPPFSVPRFSTGPRDSPMCSKLTDHCYSLA